MVEHTVIIQTPKETISVQSNPTDLPERGSSEERLFGWGQGKWGIDLWGAGENTQTPSSGGKEQVTTEGDTRDKIITVPRQVT